MKAIVCEMCGSHDVIKTDGYYVCQSCQTKYTPEEAQKLIVEGVVKIDHSERLNNLYTAARNSRSIGNYEQAKEIYGEILTYAPNDWEAAYYSVFCMVANCKIIQIESAAKTLRNSLSRIFDLIDSYAEDKERAVNTVMLETIRIAVLLHDSSLNSVNDIFKNARTWNIKWFKDYLGCAEAVVNLLLVAGNLAEKYSPPLATAAWKKGMPYLVNIYYVLDDGPISENVRNQIMKYAEKIQKYDKDFTIPERDFNCYCAFIYQVCDKVARRKHPLGTNAEAQKEGCYVATAVYGSYDCPQVWTLRRFRDYTLAKTWYGRTFIRTYYAISPTLVKWFGHTDWFKKMWKGKLDRMVENLNHSGVEDTPYEDHVW